MIRMVHLKKQTTTIVMINKKKAFHFNALTSKFKYILYLNFDVNVLKNVFFLVDHHICGAEQENRGLNKTLA